MASWFGKELFTDNTNNVLVFGSNLSGRHGRGGAKFAIQHCGAQYGNGFGPQGRSFAIPTKDEWMRVLPLDAIAQYVRQFLHFATQNPHLTFYISPIGTGLSGYQHHHIAPMFVEAPVNCILPNVWQIKNDLPLLTSAGENGSI